MVDGERDQSEDGLPSRVNAAEGLTRRTAITGRPGCPPLYREPCTTTLAVSGQKEAPMTIIIRFADRRRRVVKPRRRTVVERLAVKLKLLQVQRPVAVKAIDGFVNRVLTETQQQR